MAPFILFMYELHLKNIKKEEKIRVWCNFAEYEISHLDDLGQGQHELGNARWWEGYYSSTV